VLYSAGMALAFVSPWLAYVAYAAVAVMWFIPDRRLTIVAESEGQDPLAT
jgi:hypothetical protein